MPRFYHVEVPGVLYALDTMGSQEQALVERLFEAFSKHPRPADCTPIDLDRLALWVENERDAYAMKWAPTLSRDRKRERWRRDWWNPLLSDVFRFLQQNNHPFAGKRPELWMEGIIEDEEYTADDRLFLIYDILYAVHRHIDGRIYLRGDGVQGDYDDFKRLPVVVLTNEEAEKRCRGRVARGPVV